MVSEATSCRGEQALSDQGNWRATRVSDVPIHLARAVVPPPRLRAKWVVFSAPLQTAQRGTGRGAARCYGVVKSLRNPARVDVLRNADKYAWEADSVGASGKRLVFF